MTSTAIPQADQALLEAQAQAGPAGVKAYEAARTQLEQQQQTTLQQAAEAATARGGPAGAMGHALSVADDTYQRRLDSLTQAQATQERQYASREQRMGDYNQAVLGARDLIGAQAAAAAQPVKLRSDLEIAQMRQGADSSVRSIEANMRMMEAEAAAQMRAAEQAARLDQERWEREMAQRERLAAADRAASAAAAGGGDTRLKLGEGELKNVLRSAGIGRLDAVVASVGSAMTEGQLAKAVEDYTRDAVQGPYAERDAAITVYQKFFPKPVAADYQKNGRTDQGAWMKALDAWRANANRWRDEGPSREDFTEAVRSAQRRYRHSTEQTTTDLQALREATAAIEAEKKRARGATQTGKAGLKQMGLKSVDELARTPEWLSAITAELRAADPAVADYIKMASLQGKIRTPDDMARALGMTDLEPYEPPSELSTSGRRLLTPAGVGMQLREWDKKLPNASITEQAMALALEESAYPIYEKYQVHEGDLISAMNEQRGLSYLDLVGADADIGMKQRLTDVYDQTEAGFKETEDAARQAVLDDRADYGWNRQLTEDQRQDYLYGLGEPGRILSAARDQLEFDAFKPDLYEMELAKRNVDTAESIGGTEGQQLWSDVTGMFPLGETPFQSHTEAATWLAAKPSKLPEAFLENLEEDENGRKPVPQTYEELIKMLMDEAAPYRRTGDVGVRLNELGFRDEPDGSGNDLLYRMVTGVQGAPYDPLGDLGSHGLRPGG